MPNNYVLLEKITVGAAGAASVTFANIPQTGYTDLVIKGSARSLRASDEDGLAFGINGAGATNWVLLSGNGSSASTGTLSSLGFGAAFVGRIPGANATSNTFGNFELYLPNYTSSNQKSYLTDAVTETNGTTAYSSLLSAYQSNTAAVSSVILLASNANLAANSTFYLYGVAKLNTTPAIAPKATGGDIVMTDGTYWYHAFRSSGTFTPAANLSCDILRISGGGGGGYNLAGGGGAGGIILSSAQLLAVSTAYTATIGAGGSGSTSSGVIGGIGSQTTFTGGALSLSTVFPGGGGKGDYGAAYASASTVASAGGATGAGSFAGGTTTTGQGNNGGRNGNLAYNAGGGGGAGAVGDNGSDSVAGVGGNGGAGINTYSSWASVTGTGVSGFFAGGGGGSGMRTSTGTGAVGGTGGSGGGGTGAFDNGTSGVNFALATAGVANTGSGGGGGGWDQYSGHAVGAAGGSGLVIVRYLVA
jgi:hypothetical protein